VNPVVEVASAKKGKDAGRKRKTTKPSPKPASLHKKRKKTNATPVGTFEEEADTLRAEAQSLIDPVFQRTKLTRRRKRLGCCAGLTGK
jgi:hypothetical protein